MHKTSIIVATAVLTIGFFAEAIAAEKQLATRTAAVETVVETGLEATWNILVNALTIREFEINALIRDDRTIRVLVQTKTPSQYVDCGSISVESKHAIFGDRSYNFSAANSVRYIVADEHVDELVDVERRTSLNALASIHLTPIDQGTLVQVDVLYVMKFRTREFGTNVQTRKIDDVMNFDSSGHASQEEEIRQGASRLRSMDSLLLIVLYSEAAQPFAGLKLPEW